MSDQPTILILDIPPEYEGTRVDRTLAELLPEYSRAAIQKWIRAGNVAVEQKALKASDRVRGVTSLSVSIPPVEPAEWLAQEISLDIVYQDAHLFVINKQPGLVVHPGAGNPDQTLLNGLLHLDASLRNLPRAGIVHRLDKDTSGLMVVARSELARQRLVDQLQARTVSRRYFALVNGVPVAGETIDQPIGRHHHDRLRMAVHSGGRSAITHIRVIRKFRCHSLLEAALETGRTHQIRVHLGWRGFPLVGDATYGSRVKLPPGAGDELKHALQQFPRQALHAHALSLTHPASGETMDWRQPIPQDMAVLIAALTEDKAQHQAHS